MLRFLYREPDASAFRLIKSTARLSGEATGNVSGSINEESRTCISDHLSLVASFVDLCSPLDVP
jgi:hypothetical protein